MNEKRYISERFSKVLRVSKLTPDQIIMAMLVFEIQNLNKNIESVAKNLDTLAEKAEFKPDSPQ